MPKRIYVGNLPFSASEGDLRKIAGRYGKVTGVQVERGRSQSFGFVELADERSADEAMKALNGLQLGGNRLKTGTRPLQ